MKHIALPLFAFLLATMMGVAMLAVPAPSDRAMAAESTNPSAHEKQLNDLIQKKKKKLAPNKKKKKNNKKRRKSPNDAFQELNK